MLEVIFLSIVQGITEFLPISSSAHLILVSKYFNFSNQNLTLDISLHLGSLLAIIIYFKTDLFSSIKEKTFLYKIIFSSIPILVFGYILIELDLIDFMRTTKMIGWSTMIFGILLLISDFSITTKKIKKDFKYSSAFYIGLFQVLSLIPGVSRAGITITAARFLNFSRTESAKISFLISIPTLAMISLYNLQNIFASKSFEISLLNFFSIFLSFVFSYLTIKYFLMFLKKFSLLGFAFYRVILGILILIYAY